MTQTLDILDRLIGFNSVSHNSNLDLVDFETTSSRKRISRTTVGQPSFPFSMFVPLGVLRRQIFSFPSVTNPSRLCFDTLDMVRSIVVVGVAVAVVVVLRALVDDDGDDVAES